MNNKLLFVLITVGLLLPFSEPASAVSFPSKIASLCKSGAARCQRACELVLKHSAEPVNPAQELLSRQTEASILTASSALNRETYSSIKIKFEFDRELYAQSQPSGANLLAQSEWPLRVTPDDQDGGQFSSEMKLGLYGFGNQTYLLFVSEQGAGLPQSSGPRFVNTRILQGRLADWSLELEVLYQIHVTFKFEEALSRPESQTAVSQVETKFGVISATGDLDSATLIQAKLYVLRKMAELIKFEALNGSPEYRRSYNNKKAQSLSPGPEE